MNYLKELNEQRRKKQKEMEDLLSKAKDENRAMTEEEEKTFDKLDAEIGRLDKTIHAEERARDENQSFRKKDDDDDNAEETPEEKAKREAAEERAFVRYIMPESASNTEDRAGEKNLTLTDNGAVVPVSIANRIIKKVKDICPIFQEATGYSVKGEIRVPVWSANEGHNITVAFADDFTELTADVGKFDSVTLGGNLVGALCLIGGRLENNSAFNVTEFIIGQMAEAIAQFVEGKMLNGHPSNTMQGALETENVVTAESSAAITLDNLIDTQAAVKYQYQKNSCWTMNNKTFTAVKKLKDQNGRPLIQADASKDFPFVLLGKEVHLSDEMPDIQTGKTPILYGDYKGVSTNVREKMSIQVLREKYATQHAIGVVAWMEIDSKITDNQRLAALKMA